ncbi:MAG TPA: acetamidase/formamidase family protein [Ramlibacter sp.]|uniref:acetamidase/formamidase family protein n=1 Tax=Ramlibacter sp. TaxID=1917967 RepID=UPI002C5B7867|nr:acetamidase/formamidase family protein [Ramlibacter sp.]HVZ46609.1 acetamidase/formamidase family protein [Ramlibacter sp.]
MTVHVLRATPATVRVGMFDASFEPVLSIASGDSVEIETVSGKSNLLPAEGSGMHVPQALRAIVEADLPLMAPHIITGPVAVHHAEPGDMLEVRIDSVTLGCDWGYNYIRPLAGTLPEDFPEYSLATIPIDRERGMAELPWGMKLPLRPFFGVMGVAPPERFGRISSKEPRVHGGNIDNKELVAGSTLYLPVHVAGANFSVGDGHAAQGDGEVCVTALETCLDGKFTLHLHKGGGIGDPLQVYPRAETPTHFISMGFDEDLDQAMKQALRQMIGFLERRCRLSRGEAYQLCSLACDFHVTQTVNGEKGVHGMFPKHLLG